ncbi:MAG: site-specific DNA-methyltransferase [Pirellula sp.]|nr:site-specific DNA-methyltransferase [Pirellula sp.]
MNGLPEGCVDLAFADPPFNIGYKYDVYDDRREREHYLDWSREWISAVYRALKPSGTFWLAIGDEYAAELKVLSQEIGFHSRSWVVWYYTFGVNCVNKFTRSHAHLFYFVKDPTTFTFRGDAPENRIPSARQLVYNDSRANPKGRLPDDTWILRPQDMADCFTPEEDTWYFPRVAGTFKERAGFHGCQMPEQLLGRIIRYCSNEGETVLDPFSGSATTLVTAKKLNRNYLGFELSPEYAGRGSERLTLAEVGAPLVGAADPTRSAPATPDGSGKRGRTKGAKVAEVPAARYAMTEPAMAEFAAATATEESEAAEILAVAEVVADVEDAALSETAGERVVVEGVALIASGPEASIHVTSVEVASVDAASVTSVEPGEARKQLLVEAFRRSCQGYSADRIVTDPALQAAFQAECRRLGVAGEARDCNAALLKLRKAGRLAEVPTTARTEMTWEECEPHAAAAEMAAARVLGSRPDVSLDDLFCDPQLTAEFDKQASRVGGGRKPFAYRWTALKLRKDAHQLQERGAAWRRRELKFTTPTPTSRKNWWKSLPSAAGIYLVLNAEGTRLFVGAALDLRARLEKLLAPTKLAALDRSRDIRVSVCAIDAPWIELLAGAHALAQRAGAPLNWLSHAHGAESSTADVGERRSTTKQRQTARRPRRIVATS